MKERNVTDDINEVLKSFKPLEWHLRPVPGVYGPRSVDYLGCGFGRFFAIEAKRPGKDATDAQYVRLKKIEAAGGATFVISNMDGCNELEGWLTRMAGAYDPGEKRPTIPFREIPIIT